MYPTIDAIHVFYYKQLHVTYLAFDFEHTIDVDVVVPQNTWEFFRLKSAIMWLACELISRNVSFSRRSTAMSLYAELNSICSFINCFSSITMCFLHELKGK